MKKIFPIPLNIDCTSLKRTEKLELFGRLMAHFADVKLCEDEITASKSINYGHCEAGCVSSTNTASKFGNCGRRIRCRIHNRRCNFHLVLLVGSLRRWFHEHQN